MQSALVQQASRYWMCFFWRYMYAGGGGARAGTLAAPGAGAGAGAGTGADTVNVIHDKRFNVDIGPWISME